MKKIKNSKKKSKNLNTHLSSIAAAEVEAMREDFKREVQGFLDASGLPRESSLAFHAELPDATPVYFLTGASFTLFSEEKHGNSHTHSFYQSSLKDGKQYLMNNTATLLERLINDNKRVVVHSSNAPYSVPPLMI